MPVDCTEEGRVLRARVTGELDHHRAREVMEELDRRIDLLLPLRLTVDLSELTFTDSSGIAVALRGWQRMRELGGTVMLRHVAQQPRKVFEASGVGRMMTIE